MSFSVCYFGMNFWVLGFWLLMAMDSYMSSSCLLLNTGPVLPLSFLPSVVILSSCLCHLFQVYRLYFGVLKLYIMLKSFHFYLCPSKYTCILWCRLSLFIGTVGDMLVFTTFINFALIFFV